MEKVGRWAGEKVSGNQVIRISGYQDIRISGTPDHPITRSPDTPIPRFPDTPIRYKTGFTLLEIMVVVVIIAIMLGVGITKFVGFFKGTGVIKLGARDVASVLRLSHQQAIVDGVRYLAVIDVDGSGAGGKDGSKDEIWLKKETAFLQADWSNVGKPNSWKVLHKEVNITDVKNQTGLYYIAFLPGGRAYGSTTEPSGLYPATEGGEGTSIHITNKSVTDAGTAETNANRDKWYTVYVITSTSEVRTYSKGYNTPFSQPPEGGGE